MKSKTWQTLHVNLGSKSFVMKLIKFCGSRFFKQFILLLCISQMANGLFRLLAAVGRSPVVANTFGSAALLVLFVLGGFILSRGESFIHIIIISFRLPDLNFDGKKSPFVTQKVCKNGCCGDIGSHR